MSANPTPNPVDVYVGARIRLRRRELKLSQSALARAIGLTFQQVQKYERGANRVSASMMYKASKFLEVPISYFFDGLDGETEIRNDESDGLSALKALIAVPQIKLVTDLPKRQRQALGAIITGLSEAHVSTQTH